MQGPVLVANRGEIAWRVLRACRERGLPTVAVYSEADRDAPWLAAADDAHLLGPAPAAESYLDTERLLAVARRAGAEAVHPGYGFLSESAEFARAVTEAGMVWIGPPAEAIEAMGDKLSARAAATTAECPVVPGTMEPTDDPEVVRAFAEQHGFPIAIKAAHGGGGRGLKVVRDPVGLEDALEGAQREAVAAFGRGEVYVERYLRRPRHVEIQVLADHHGHLVHLGERDCSTQRRHQKLIEEAPAPHLDPAVRDAMGTAALRVAREVGYTGAGTCEFLYEDGEFFFLEMNTRLQVEHPVTELVTGQDIVQWQLRIAAGEPLELTQSDVVLRGHAIEARVNAEHVAASFAPSPGRVTRWSPPGGPGVRVDAGVVTGWAIPRDYDSLMAKIVAYGADREEARRKLLAACEEALVEGVPTTLDFHRFALAHEDFIAGAVATVSVEHEWDLSPIAPAAPPEPSEGPARPSRTLTVEVGGRRLDVSVFDDRSTPSSSRRRATARSAVGGGPGEVTAPMQGTITKTSVAVGDPVHAGDVLVVLEAMKMENHVTAPRDGVVERVAVGPGDHVDLGAPLVTIAAEEAASASHA
ncbi:ATP-grasp domain-containing protein [Egibacter rhizosphaerae]|uniref:biotin carboxylase n=1 Tax=Egibacter rhizosphaerae TaxID=1670831 RepID=A0A411YHQ3_9ACTN|nr:biotin carboxylase N-terminal domain-containing protein [Egibacter rhizosphaerae]QBI20651.1 ATP-grasp domain-containing protein [Egibacter rhizosphaerae]